MAKKAPKPKPSTPTGALKPKGYKITKWPPSKPARLPKPPTEAGRESLGFYDKTRIISIDRASGRFIYNPEIPPRVRQPPRLRCGIGSLVGLRLGEVGTNESLLFWRLKVLGARMRYLRATGRYNPYLKCGALIKSSRGQEVVNEELKSYLRLKEEDERKSMILEKAELMDYVKVLEDRERARQIEDEADAAEVEKLLEEIWPNIEGSIDTGSTTMSASKDEDMLVREPAKIENKSRDSHGDDGLISPKGPKIGEMKHGTKRKTKPKVKRKTKAHKVEPSRKSRNSFQGGVKDLFRRPI